MRLGVLWLVVSAVVLVLRRGNWLSCYSAARHMDLNAKLLEVLKPRGPMAPHYVVRGFVVYIGALLLDSPIRPLPPCQGAVLSDVYACRDTLWLFCHDITAPLDSKDAAAGVSCFDEGGWFWRCYH